MKQTLNQLLPSNGHTVKPIDCDKDGGFYYGGDLYLRGSGITSLPDNLTVGGGLNLRGTGITSLPDSLTVGGSLYLGGGITSLPDNLTVGGSLYLGGGITSLPDNLTVGGDLDLRGTGITSLPDSLAVGGYLDLRGTGITSLPDNLTVGGFLDLENCTGITSLPDNLTVGGGLDLRGTGITDTTGKVNKNIPIIYTWRNQRYIKADGIFSEIISHKGNVYRTKQIGKSTIGYLITDGNGKWAHGATLEEARADLIYKVGNRDKSVYEKLTMESKLTFEEAIVAYSVITGACSFGTRNFIENQLSERKENYSIAEIIELTTGKYGNSIFKAFFKEKDEGVKYAEA